MWTFLPSGSTRCRVCFCTPADVPETVRPFRHLQGTPFRSILPREDVIHFHKDMQLNCVRLTNGHTRLESITEILRLKLDAWFAEMDDPFNSLSCLEGDERVTIAARRVYHLNLVLQRSRADGAEKPALFTYRVRLNRQGIVGIEQMERVRS